MKSCIALLIAALTTTAAHSTTITLQKAAVPAAHGMFAKSENEIWLADTFNNLDKSSQLYDLNGKRIKNTLKGAGIAGISKHPKQDLYAYSDLTSSNIILVNSAGKEVQRISAANPWNARWSPSGKTMLVVTHAGKVEAIAEKSRETLLSELDAPFDVAPISDSEYWVSEQGANGVGRVCKYAKSKQVLCNKGVELDNPEGLWPLPDGSVMAVDTGRGTLVQINIDGSTKIIAAALGIPILVQGLSNGKWLVYTNQSPQGPAIILISPSA